MIQLLKGTVFVARSGVRIALDLDELQRDVERAGKAAKILEPDLAKDIVELARGVCRRRSANPPSLEELEQLVVQALVDSGLAGMARAFQQLRKVPPPSPEADFRPVDGMPVEAILQADPYFFSRPVDAIGPEVLRSLEQLGLTQATPGFVRQLARHLWVQRQEVPSTTPSPGYWLVTRQQMAELVAEHRGRQLSRAGIEFRPVSGLMPRLVVDWDLVALAAQFPDEPLTELTLLPAFDQACNQLGSVLGPISEQLVRLAEGAELAGILHLRNLQPVAVGRMGLGARQQARFKQELASMLSEHLGSRVETVLEGS